MHPTIINIAYLIASVLFIVGLKGLSHPKTAVRGNFLGGLGMLIAMVVTLLDRNVVDFKWIILGLAIGTLIGVIMAVKIEMTAMPQLVALFNGFGGIASVLVAGAALYETQEQLPPGAVGEAVAKVTAALGTTAPGPSMQLLVATVASGIIGAVTFTGSLIAFAKLQEIKAIDKIKKFPGQSVFNVLLFAGSAVVGAYVCVDPSQVQMYWVIAALGGILGIFLTTPIGGADMPVVIALLNSYSGIAASATGFVLDNNVLIIAGSLVGASGIILTSIMCKAMNRSLWAVLFGTMDTSSGPSADDVYAGKIKATSAEELAMMLEMAQRVVIVPGYGLAVAQAQHAVRDLTNLLTDRGITVEFGIHPVAGRMPGHMNVLLAEADISYEALKEMDEINPTFEQVDVVIVIGANDVVNPVARTDPKSPIAGMPILDVDKARTVIIVKRSLSPGFAGIPNPLFAADNALMFFGDAKKALIDLNAAIKAG
ncbi:MAG: NAD(P)(+) transhydrogenase (Re/Si-specific) subunit beta [Deltaproteobacteria bacterium]|nr:NAD(P)(+) transhydrogenase (Re/Si-specific) subunit beta [Deltaproteobacteria bacterium]